MTPHDKAPLPERVAILETLVPEVREAVRGLHSEQGRMVAQLNTLLLEMTTFKAIVADLVASRSIWRNPLVWTNIASLGVALFVALSK